MSDDGAFKPGSQPRAQTTRARPCPQDTRTTSARRRVARRGVYAPGTLVAKRYKIRGTVRCEPDLQVFKAVDQKHGTPVFLNVALQSQGLCRRFEREAALAESVRRIDPGPKSGFVVQRGWGCEGGLLFQVIETIRGAEALEPFNPQQGVLEQLPSVGADVSRQGDVLGFSLTVRAAACRSSDFKLLLDTVIRPSKQKVLETLTKAIKAPSPT